MLLPTVSLSAPVDNSTAPLPLAGQSLPQFSGIREPTGQRRFFAVFTAGGSSIAGFVNIAR
jgi:hypothetical protein